MQDRKVFVVDVSICNGCYCCQLACKDEHAGNEWLPYARPQPDTGQFWLRLEEHLRGSVPKVKMHYIPQLCRHCESAACVAACPVEGAIYQREDGLVIIDPLKCTGCRNCVDACPSGSIFFNQDLNIAQKCTGCAHLLDEGWPEPRCVDACPTRALRFGRLSEFKDVLPPSVFSSAQVSAESGPRPAVFYLNVPGLFLAGTVVDPAVQEVVSGASCALQGAGREWSVETDGFGDFWFDNLAPGTYTLEIRKDARRRLETYQLEKDLNLGTLPL